MIVSKATAVYVIMVVVLAGGLWLILELGSTLVPPTDLAGNWELTSATGTDDLWVEQSGKFVNLRLNNWTANMKIEKDAGQHPTQTSGVTMSSKDETVAFEGLGITDHCTVRLTGAFDGVYQAHRTHKMFH